jgi:hypothetical protein
MNKKTIEQLKFWIIDRRNYFNRYLENDYVILNLPVNLQPQNIEMNIFADHLNGITLINDLPLYLNYTNLFPILDIQLTDSHQYKVFLMFYKLSLFYCPTQEAWDIYRADETNIDALKKESIQKINTNPPNVYYPI